MKIAFNRIEELSYLTEQQQDLLLQSIKDNAVSIFITCTKKEIIQCDKHFSEDTIYDIMTEEKANQKEKITLK